MKKYFIHSAVFRLLAPAVYGVFIYLLVLLINNNLQQLNEIFSGQEVYICIALTYLTMESGRLRIVLLDRSLKGRWLGLRIPVQLLMSLAFTLTLVAGSLTAYFQFAVGFAISTSQLFIFLGIYLLTAILYNLLYFSNYYLQRENTLKLSAEKQQREVPELEMAEFKNDINPDLLYEGLEGVVSLMYRSQEKAEEHIDCLASAYRYSLTNRQKELVPLTAEIQAARNMIQLMNEKYHGQLYFEVAFRPEEVNCSLIPGSLPVALEAIVRNTIISSHEPLMITCSLEDPEYLTLQSKLNERLIPHTESLLSLKRLQKSYSLYSDRPLIQVKAYEENYIKLPVLRVAEEILTTG